MKASPLDPTFIQMKAVQKKLLEDHSVMDHCNGCGIGVRSQYSDPNTPIGITLFFETEEQMRAFPIKEDTFEGVPLYKEVVGVIRAL